MKRISKVYAKVKRRERIARNLKEKEISRQRDRDKASRVTPTRKKF